MITNETLSGLYWACSNIEPETTYKFIKTKLDFLPQDVRPAYDYLIQFYDNFQKFPEFNQAKSDLGLSVESSLEAESSRDLFKKVSLVFEQDTIMQQLSSTPLGQRAPLIKRLSELGNETVADDETLNSTRSFKLEGSVIKSGKREEGSDILWPTKHLNERAPLRKGMIVGILGTPGSGKSGLGLNMVYINSVCSGSKHNSLYIYGENTESVYQAELRSHFSYDIGMCIENTSLKQGVYEDDPLAVKKIEELESKFNSLNNGTVYFLPMTKLPKDDPTLIGPAIANYVKKYNIELVLFDHLQCLLSIKPARWDKVEYLNTAFSSMRMASIGLYNSDPFVTCVLSQVNRETQARQERTAKISLGSSYSCSSLDQDCFVVISIVATNESKQANLVNIQILKSRDGWTDLAPLPCPALFQYNKIGDVGEEASSDSSDIFTNDTLDSLFDDL